MPGQGLVRWLNFLSSNGLHDANGMMEDRYAALNNFLFEK